MTTDSQVSPTVLPLEVPWTVSTSVSHLELSCAENRDCTVRCDAFFGHHSSVSHFQRVEIIFERAICCRMLASRSDDEMPGGDEYNWSKVYVPPKNPSEFRARLESQSQRWAMSGHCPDPHFYLIDQSAWAREFRHQCQHFLLVGTDSYVEVLASDFRWLALNPIQV